MLSFSMASEDDWLRKTDKTGRNRKYIQDIAVSTKELKTVFP